MRQLLIVLFFCLGMLTRAGAQSPSLVLQKGHFKKINSIRFSKDEKWMVTTSDDGIIKIWDAFSQKLVTELGGNGVVYLDAFFSGDGKRVIASAEQTGEGGEFGPGRGSYGMAQYYMLYQNTPFYVWDIETSQLVYSASNIHETHSISPDAAWVAIHPEKIKDYDSSGKWQAVKDAPISIYNVSTGKLLKQITQYQDTSTDAEPFIAFVADSMLLTGIQTMAMLYGQKKYITKYRVLNFFTDKETASFNDTSSVNKVGQWLLSSGRKYFLRYNQGLHFYKGEGHDRDELIELWDIQKHTLIWSKPLELQSCSFSRNDSVISMLHLPMSNDSLVDPGRLKMLQLFIKDTVATVQLAGDYTPDVISTGSNGPRFIATAVIEEHNDELPVPHTDTTRRITILDNAHKVVSYTETKNLVTAISFSPNDKFLVTGHEDGNISLWDFKDSLAKEIANSGNIIDPVVQLHTGKASKKVWYITKGMYGMKDANTINKLSFIANGTVPVKDVHYLLKDKYTVLNIADEYGSNGSFLIIDNDTPSVVKQLRYDVAPAAPVVPAEDSSNVDMPGKNKWRIKLGYPGLQSFTIYNSAPNLVNPQRNMFIQSISLVYGILKSTSGTDTTLLFTNWYRDIQYNNVLKSHVIVFDLPYIFAKGSAKEIANPIFPKPNNLFLTAPLISDDGRYLLGRDSTGKNSDPEFYYSQDLKSNIVFKTPVLFQQERLGLLSKFAISPNKKLACILSDPLLSLGGHFVRVINAQNGLPLYNLKLNNAGSVSGAEYTPDSKYVYTWSAGGTCTKWDLTNGHEVFTMVFFKDHDYAIILPDGYYFISSRTDAKYLNFKLHNKLYNFSQFDLQFNRPDKVLQAIGSTDKSLMDEYYKAWQGRVKKSGFTENDISSIGLHAPAIILKTDKMEPFTAIQYMPVSFIATDSLFNIKSYNVFVNDVPVNGINGHALINPARHISVAQQVWLSEGMNKIEVTCTNENAVMSRKEVMYISYAPVTPAASKTYFIGIGINRYSAHSSFVDLSYCVKDIRDLSAAFKEKYKEALVIDTLMNEAASKENILALKKKLLQTEVNDKVIVSFSGHGMVDPLHPGDFYFVTGTTDVNNPAENGISYAQLEELLDSIPARKKLLLLDACHSGEADDNAGSQSNHIPGIKRGNDNNSSQAGSIEILDVVENSGPKNTSATDIFKLMKEAFVDIRRNNGAYVLSAAQSNESAGEGGGINNGWFSSCLIEQLKSNKSMSVNELSQKVNQCVSAKSGGNQNTDNRQELAEVNWQLWD